MGIKGLGKILVLTAALAGGFFVPRSNADSLRVYNASTNTDISTSDMYIQHFDGAEEGYDSSWDIAWSNGPPEPSKDKWFKINSEPYSVDLYTDARPTNSESLFQSKLKAMEKTGGSVTGGNYIRFRFYSKDSNRIYTAQVNCYSNWTPDGKPFYWVGNFTNNQYINLPGVANCPSGTTYGTLDVSCKFLDHPSLNGRVTNNGNNIALETLVQSGSIVTDNVYFTQDLTSTNWQPVATNAWGYVTPTSNNFNSTEGRTNSVDISGYTKGYFKLGRKQISE